MVINQISIIGFTGREWTSQSRVFSTSYYYVRIRNVIIINNIITQYCCVGLYTCSGESIVATRRTRKLFVWRIASVIVWRVSLLSAVLLVSCIGTYRYYYIHLYILYNAYDIIMCGVGTYYVYHIGGGCT